MLRIVPLFLAFLIGLSFWPAAARDRTAAGQRGLAYCWEAQHKVLTVTLPGQCGGVIVSSGQAGVLNRIAERARQDRRAKAELWHRSSAAYEFDSAGTAFAVNADGDYLTSAHVIDGCDRLEARLGDQILPLPITIRARDERLDLAVLNLPAQSDSFLRFATLVPENGEPLALIGFPKQTRIPQKPNLTPVRVTHGLRDPRKGALTGLRGDVRRGHSGGPALDSRGRAVGVLKAKINTKEAYRRTGRTFTHLGVLVDARRVVRFLERARTRYWMDGREPRERSERELFGIGTRAVIRVDCLKRK